MKQLTRILLSFTLFFMITSLYAQDSWSVSMTKKLRKYTYYSERFFNPYLKRDNLKYAPSELALLIFKNSQRLEVYARNKNTKWEYVTEFPILAASGGFGPKLREGDRQVPEGIYHITELNPNSRFDLSMHINYPNAFDLAEADSDHRQHLGGSIYIHGNRLSIGCIAIGDKAIQELFPLVYYSGIDHVTVVIAPDDFRLYRPVYGHVHPRWVTTLYSKIKIELKQFPLA